MSPDPGSSQKEKAVGEHEQDNPGDGQGQGTVQTIQNWSNLQA